MVGSLVKHCGIAEVSHNNICFLPLADGWHLPAVLVSLGPNFSILSQMALDGWYREARYVVFGATTLVSPHLAGRTAGTQKN